jgi:hypothetical protein
MKIHTSRCQFRSGFEEQKLEVMDVGLARSPDLNPTENLLGPSFAVNHVQGQYRNQKCSGRGLRRLLNGDRPSP